MSLEAARHKITRSFADWQKAVGSLKAWDEAGGMRMEPAIDPEYEAQGVALVVGSPAPIDAALDAARSIEELRSILDHIAWDAYLRGGGSPTAKIYFPIATPEGRLASAKSNKWARDLPHEIADLFLRSQHLEDDSPLFPRMSAIAAGDKHTDLAIIGVPSRELSFVMPERPDPTLDLSLNFAPDIDLSRPATTMLGWSSWHEMPAGSEQRGHPIRRDDPRAAGGLPHPEVTASLRVGVRCGGGWMAITEIHAAGTRITEMLDAYEHLIGAS